MGGIAQFKRGIERGGGGKEETFAMPTMLPP